MAENLSVTLPRHVAIILDGNRRWAKQKGLPISEGHRKVAMEVIEHLADFAIRKGIQYLTLWAFSTENWHRSEEEVSTLMTLFREGFAKSTAQLHKKGVRIITIGDLSRFADDIQQGINKRVEETKNNTQLVVIFALNYGGRNEILRASKKMLHQARKENWSEDQIEKITEEAIEQQLDTAQTMAVPDPDLLIRPGGEQRLSGFMPWQTTYTELYFTPTLMPDFDDTEFQKALDEYARRNRRFGH